MAPHSKTGTEVMILVGPFQGWRAAVIEEVRNKLRVKAGTTQFLISRKDVRRMPQS